MKHRFLSFVPLLLLLAFGICLISFLISPALRNNPLPFLGKSGNITLRSQDTVTTSFSATENNLSEIRVYLKTFPKLTDTLTLKLQDQTCQNTLATSAYSTWRPLVGPYTSFSFAPQKDSLGTTYCLTLSFTSKDSSQKIKIRTTDHFFYKDQRYLLRGKEKTSETIQFIPAYQKKSSDIIKRMSQYKPNIVKGWPIVLLLIVTLLGSILLIAILILKEEDSV
jgi:hypothetical protein